MKVDGKPKKTVKLKLTTGDVSKYYLCHVRNFNRTEGNIPESIDSTNFKFGTLIDTWEVDNC